MKHILSLLLALLAAAPAFAATPPVLYKSPTCGCCVKYVEYLKQSGLDVKAVDVTDLNAVKNRFGVAPDSASCHTMTLEGYVIEGHVPVGAIRKLLAERPKIRGVSVPGMPQNSPGMGEHRAGTLPVYVIDANGAKSRVYSVE